MQFKDRHHAGEVLAQDLRKYAGRDDVIVLALPRGGVPVAFEVARALDATLDVVIARKLGAPGHEEYGIGAIASGDAMYVDEASVRAVGATREQLDEVVRREKAELARREATYRGDRTFPTIEDRIVILVDDGIATGVTMRAAITALNALKPRELVVAVPVAPPDTVEQLAPFVDDVVIVSMPAPFQAVGLWYEDFEQTTDEEVESLLEAAVTYRQPRPRHEREASS